MSAVKRDTVIVRDGLSALTDTKYFDPGVDCSVDYLTGEAIPSMTKQSFRDECDINSIMARYEKDGVVDHLARVPAQWGDFTDALDYHSAMSIVVQAEERFAALPASVRKRFGNDPAQMLEFLEDPDNRLEAIELGLVDPPPKAAEPTKVEVVNPAPPPKPDPAPKPSKD